VGIYFPILTTFNTTRLAPNANPIANPMTNPMPIPPQKGPHRAGQLQKTNLNPTDEAPSTLCLAIKPQHLTTNLKDDANHLTTNFLDYANHAQ
jgi:hypothetical protein